MKSFFLNIEAEISVLTGSSIKPDRMTTFSLGKGGRSREEESAGTRSMQSNMQWVLWRGFNASCIETIPCSLSAKEERAMSIEPRILKKTQMKTYKLVGNPVVHANGNGNAKDSKSGKVGLAKLEDVLAIFTE